jgi:hypothetical protein
VASAFDGACKLTLVFGTYTRLAARPDFTFIGDEPAQDLDLFVVDTCVLVGTERAFARASEEPPTPGLIFFSGLLVAQLKKLLAGFLLPAVST